MAWCHLCRVNTRAGVYVRMRDHFHHAWVCDRCHERQPLPDSAVDAGDAPQVTPRQPGRPGRPGPASRHSGAATGPGGAGSGSAVGRPDPVGLTHNR